VFIEKSPIKKNLFLFGLFFGFGFYISGISWITNSLTFEDDFKIFIPFALIFIPLFLSLFSALTTLIIGPHLKLNFTSIILFSGGMAFSDYLRAKLFTGFPWNLWAYSTSWINEILQILNLTGLYLYNLLIITLFTIPIIFFLNINIIKKSLIISCFLAITFALYLYGDFVINKNKKLIDEADKSIYIKVVSPNFELEYGLDKNQIEKRFENLIRYSDPKKDKKTVFIWPEGVFSGYSFKEIKIFRKIIANNFSKKHLIVFGANKEDQKTGNFYNSMFVVNNDFEVIKSYNKQKLVPFGEFLPFEKLLNNLGFKKITEGHGSFLKGNENKNLVINELNILPMICYEVIFTDLIQNSSHDTNLIINISEDGWFGNSIGPNQHFSKSIFRAIENNTFLIRSANKGISAIIDNKGNIIKQLNRNEAGNIELKVPLIKTNKVKNDLIFLGLLITYLLVFFIYKEKNAK
jgi:apolipoprotein N-acyltransferase